MKIKATGSKAQVEEYRKVTRKEIKLKLKLKILESEVMYLREFFEEMDDRSEGAIILEKILEKAEQTIRNVRAGKGGEDAA